MRGGVDGLAWAALVMTVGFTVLGVAAGQDAVRGPEPVATASSLDTISPNRTAFAVVPVPATEPPRTTRGVADHGHAPDVLARPTDAPYRSFTVAATGDLLIHSPVRARAATGDSGFDFGPQLAAAQPVIDQADLGLCHLEVPLDPDGPYSSYPIFNAPASLATAIADTGWDVCSTASNHSADQGFDGVGRTLDALDAAGVGHRGMARTALEWARPPLLEVQDVTVGLLSATYGLNGLPPPGGHEWSVQLIDPAQLIHRASQLRRAGADVVIVSLHWGNEYQHEPSQFQREVATSLLTSGVIDAIIGHHAHVVQPVEWVAERPVVYGLGNFLSGQRPTERRDGVVVSLSFSDSADGWTVTDLTAQPTWVDEDYRVVLADTDSSDPTLAASATRTLAHLGLNGE